jgi:mannose-6-phosphate isomerase-like protein (cupin superfamily)
MERPHFFRIEDEVLANDHFRHVVYTTTHSQIVYMTLQAGEEIGMEVHDVDQFFRFEAGEGRVDTDSDTYAVIDGDAVIIPAGVHHNVTNTGSGPLKFYTIYAPANHKQGTIHHTKAEADTAEAEEHGHQ